MRISTKCSIALHCLLFIAEYESQTKVTSQLLSKSTGCNPVVIRNTLLALKKAGMISVARGVGGAHLAMKPDNITIWKIYSILEPECLEHLIGIHANPSESCPVGEKITDILTPPYRQIQHAVMREMQKINLTQLLKCYHGTT